LFVCGYFQSPEIPSHTVRKSFYASAQSIHCEMLHPAHAGSAGDGRAGIKPLHSTSYRASKLLLPVHIKKRKTSSVASPPSPLSPTHKKLRQASHNTQTSPCNQHNSELVPYRLLRPTSFTSRFKNPSLTPLFIPPVSAKLGALEVDPLIQKVWASDVSTPSTAELKLPTLGRKCDDDEPLPGFHEVLDSVVQWRPMRWDTEASERRIAELSPKSVN
jgi:hypothetical protein